MPGHPRGFALAVVLPLIVEASAAQFVRPTAAQTAAALGPLDGLPAATRRAFDPRGFQPVRMPAPMDWLANHPEPGQSVSQFIGTHPNTPDNYRRTLYLLPLGEIERRGGPPLAKLAQFSRAFFGLETKILPPLNLHNARITRRLHPLTWTEQILTTDVLALLKTRLPPDAFALLGVTMEDLYPAADWNYVFGQASLRDRVGIYSFARYSPALYGQKPPNPERVVLRRSCRFLAHEASHMFGISHCIWYHCLMNGSNHLAESDAQPLHLCPVDLRKLQWSVGFDLAERYRRLLAFYAGSGLSDEAAWLRARLNQIEGS